MKKVLLPALVLFATGSFAQTYFSDDFADLSAWTLYDQDGDGNDWESTSTVVLSGSTPAELEASLPYAISRSWAGSPLTPDNYMVSEAIVIPGGAANAYLQWTAGGLQDGFHSENYTVYIATGDDLASATSGTSVFTDVIGAGFTAYNESVDISSYAGSTIHVVFRHHDVTDENGLIIDDVVVKTLPAVDMSMTSLDMSSIVAAGSVTISGTVTNDGANPITSFDVEWNDGGTPNSQTFSTTVAPGASYNWTHSTTYTAVAGTTPNIEACVVATGDADAGNDCMDMDISVASGTGTRLALMETFTSSTCPPCYTLAVSGFGGSGLISYYSSANVNDQTSPGAAAISYQVNWPGSGDHAYNADVANRVSYYGITGAPTTLVDAGTSGTPGHVDAANAVDAYIDITATHTIASGELTVDVTVDPYISVTGATVHIALLDEGYDATGDASFSNGETEFHHVLRKMIPDANGTTASFTGGTPYTQTETYSYTINSGLPPQGSFDLHPTSTQEVVVFVQDSDGNILNAAVSKGTQVLSDENGVEEFDFNVSVYPNPTSDMTNISITVAEQSDVNVEIFNTVGELVYSNNNTSVTAGNYLLPVDITNFAAGTYVVKTTVNEAVQTTKLMVK